MEITSRMFLKLDCSALHPLDGEKVPMTVFDRATADVFMASARAYPAPAPSNKALKEGLLRAVALYPHLAGRLAVDGRGRRFLHVNNEGVLVIEATVQADLADVLPDARANVDELYPTPPEVSKNMMSSICELIWSSAECFATATGERWSGAAADQADSVQVRGPCDRLSMPPPHR
jgi:hypothetical protein